MIDVVFCNRSNSVCMDYPVCRAAAALGKIFHLSVAIVSHLISALLECVYSHKVLVRTGFPILVSVCPSALT